MNLIFRLKEQFQRFRLLFSQSSAARWALVFLVLPLISGSAMSYWAISESEWLHQQSVGSWVVIFILLSIPIAFSIIPNTLAGILAGHFLGLWALAGMATSFSIACIIGFFVGKMMESGIQETVFDLWPSTRKTLERMEKQSLLLVILLRLSPAPPFAVGTILLSWMDFPFRTFLLGSVLGMLPRMALVVAIGSQIGQLAEMVRNPSQIPELRWSSLIFLAIALIGFYWLKSRMANQEK